MIQEDFRKVLNDLGGLYESPSEKTKNNGIFALHPIFIFTEMKKKIIVTGFFIGWLIHCNAQNIGLSMDALSKYMPPPPKGLLQQSTKLYLPQVRQPLVKVQQNVFYSQLFYPQMALKPTWERHYAVMNRHLLLYHSPKELFIDRVTESLIANLFGDN